MAIPKACNKRDEVVRIQRAQRVQATNLELFGLPLNHLARDGRQQAICARKVSRPRQQSSSGALTGIHKHWPGWQRCGACNSLVRAPLNNVTATHITLREASDEAACRVGLPDGASRQVHDIVAIFFDFGKQRRHCNYTRSLSHNVTHHTRAHSYHRFATSRGQRTAGTCQANQSA